MKNISKEAEELYSENNAQEAVILLAQELEKNPQQLDLILQLSTYLSFGGEFDQAKELLLKSKNYFQDSEEIDYNLGNVYYSEENYALAETVFQELVNNKFGHDALFMLSQSLYKQQKYNIALVYALTAAEQNKEDESYFELVGDIFMSTGDFKNAYKYYEISYNIKKNGKNSFNLGLCAMILDKDSKKFFESSKKQDPTYYKKNIEKLDDIQKLINNPNR